MELDEKFFDNKSTICIAKQISNLCNEKLNKEPKNMKNHIKKTFNQRSNTPTYSSSGFSSNHFNANSGLSHWAKIKKDLSKLKLTKFGRQCSIQKKRSMSCDSQDEFKINLELPKIPLSPTN